MSGSRFYQKTTLAGLINAFSGKALALVNLWLWNQLLLRHEFGEFIFAIAIIEILALLATTGADQGVIFRLTKQEIKNPRQFAGASMGLAIGAGLVIALVVSALGNLHSGFLKFWIPVLSIVIPIKAAASVLGGWFRSQSRVSSAIYLEQSLPCAIKTGLLLVALLGSFGTRAVIVAEVLAPLLAIAPFWFRERLNPLAAIRLRLDRLTLRYNFHLLGARLLQRGLDRSDIVMLGILTTSTVVADYAVAARFAVLVTFAHEMLNAAFTVRLGKLLGASTIKEAHLEYRRVQYIAILGALLAATVLGGFGGWIMQWIGDYREAHSILMVLVLAHLAKVCFGSSGVYLKMSGRSASAAVVSGVALGLNLLANCWLIPRWGGQGAAWATFGAMFLSNVLAAWLIWRVAKFSCISAPSGAALIVSGATLALGGGHWIDPIQVLVILFVFSIIFYPRGHRAFQELLDHRHETR